MKTGAQIARERRFGCILLGGYFLGVAAVLLVAAFL